MTPSSAPVGELLTTSQAAGVVGVSVATFGRYVHNGWIVPAHTIGRSNLYRRADVDALHRKLHPHENGPAAPA
jgi:excisionase family DNA binding protein